MNRKTLREKLSIYELTLFKLFVPNALSSICTLIIGVFDAVVSGFFIGPTALAAIGLASPFQNLNEGIHALIGRSVGRLYARKRIQYDKRTADRFIGTVLWAAIFIYVLALPLMLWGGKYLLRYMTNDSELIKLAIEYLLPTIIAYPLIEFMDCLHSAYKVDGRPGLFSLKEIISAAASILFTLAAVIVFKAGLMGIAIGASLAKLLGYTVDLIHYFSKQCTVHPDFSVIANKEECVSHLKEDTEMGMHISMWYLIVALYSGTMNKLFYITGGSAALAIYGVVKVVLNALSIVSTNIQDSFILVGSILLGGNDYNSFKKITRLVFVFIGATGAFFSLIVIILAEPICLLMGMTADIMPQAILCLRIIMSIEVFMLLGRFYVNYETTIERYDIARLLGYIENIVILPLMFLLRPFGVPGLLIGIYGPIALHFLTCIFMMMCGKFWPDGKDDEGELYASHVDMSMNGISAISNDIGEFLLQLGYGREISYRGSLLAEEFLQKIRLRNEKILKSLKVYLRIRDIEDKLKVVICDNGAAFNLLEKAQLEDTDIPISIEDTIIRSMSEDMIYDRFLELNYISISINAEKLHSVFTDKA